MFLIKNYENTHVLPVEIEKRSENELPPKSFVSNFWGAAQTAMLFLDLSFKRFIYFTEKVGTKIH